MASNDRLWAGISWGLLAVGAILTLMLKSENAYVRKWAYMSIAFTILVFIAFIPTYVIAFILSLIPFIGGFFYNLIMGVFGVSVLIVYLVGLVKAVEGRKWQPPVIDQFADFLCKI